jgi:hypothetical protein
MEHLSRTPVTILFLRSSNNEFYLPQGSGDIVSVLLRINNKEFD